jgi:putative phosphoribosyl transferase
MKFQNRREAGQRLANGLGQYGARADALVLGLPRGGVPVAYEVARALKVPLGVLLVRKLGVPGHEELAMGAIASGGVRLLDESVSQRLRVPRQAIADVIDRESRELQRLEDHYQTSLLEYEPPGKVVILVDDGLATGSSMQAAVMALRERDPARIVVAVPVAPPSVAETLRTLVDEFVCLDTPTPFKSVGRWYDEFSEVTHDAAGELLRMYSERAEGEER